jgi:hypothetical protein
MISSWFNHVRATIDKYGILSDNIYNFDKTSFALGLTITTKIMTKISYGRRALLQPRNR